MFLGSAPDIAQGPDLDMSNLRSVFQPCADRFTIGLGCLHALARDEQRGHLAGRNERLCREEFRQLPRQLVDVDTGTRANVDEKTEHWTSR